jgi:hypothetical protein
MVSNVFPDFASTNRPSMNSCVGPVGVRVDLDAAAAAWAMIEISRALEIDRRRAVRTLRPRPPTVKIDRRGLGTHERLG